MTSLAFDPYQFANRASHPVSAELTGDGSWSSPGISFDDYSRMTTQRKKSSGERRLPTPEWAVNTEKLREVVTRAYEIRAGLRYQQQGTEMERLRRAQVLLIKKKERRLVVLDNLCREFVELKQSGADPVREKELARYIEQLDSNIVLDDRGPGVIAAVIYFYYRVGLDSVGVSAALRGSPKPEGVRQLLYRLHRIWEELQNGGPPVCPVQIPKSPRVKLTPEERRERIKAYNAKRRRARGMVPRVRRKRITLQTKKFGEVSVLEVCPSSSGGLVHIETEHGPLWARAKKVFGKDLFI